MTDFPSGPNAMELARSMEAYVELVDEQLLALASSFLQDVEVNAQLFANSVRGGPKPDSSLAMEPTLEGIICRAAPAGLKLFRLGAEGQIVIPTAQVHDLLRAALVPAAREMARLKFSGPDAEPTRREVWARMQALHLEAGKPDEAAAFEIAEDDEAMSWADEIGPNIFDGPRLPDLSGTEVLAEADDNERLEGKERAERARSLLIDLLGECDVPRNEWQVDVAALAARIDEMIEVGFAAPKNYSSDLTREIFKGVEAAFAKVGETGKLVLYQYTAKIMELAGLGAARGGGRAERVRKALSRDVDPIAR